MQRQTKMMLAVFGVIVVLIIAYIVPLLSQSKSEFTEQDSKEWLNRLADAFIKKNANEVLSFAYPDAIVAGKTLKAMDGYLRQAMSAAPHLDVQFTDINYKREGTKVTLNTNVAAGERAPGSAAQTDSYYKHPVVFIIERRGTPQLGGLFTTYEWKATNVEASGLPNLDSQ